MSTNPQLRTSVVLGGGGSRGSFEVGALTYLYETQALAPTVVAGCSIGAVIAATIATSSDPAIQLAAVGQLDQLIRHFPDHRSMFVEEDWFRAFVDRLPDAASALRHLRGAPGPSERQQDLALPGFDSARDPFDREDPEHRGLADSWAALRTLGRAARGIEPNLREAFRARSLYNLGPLRRLLEDPDILGLDAVATSSMTLRLPVVSLESGDLRYVTEAGTFVDRQNAPLPALGQVALIDAVCASAAVPGVFPAVRLGEEHYVDGGVRELLPLEIVTEHLGVSACFAILAQAPGVSRRGGMEGSTILPVVARALADIAMDEIRRDDVAAARRTPGVTVIEPEINVHGSLEVDPGLIAVAIDYGYMRAADVVSDLSAEQCGLSRLITEARMAPAGKGRDRRIADLVAEREPHGLPRALRELHSS